MAINFIPRTRNGSLKLLLAMSILSWQTILNGGKIAHGYESGGDHVSVQ
jgi:hypothetical protein